MSKLIAVWGTPQSGKTTFTVKLANALNLGGKGKSIHSAIAVFPDITTPVVPTVFPNKKDEELYSLGSVLQKPDLTRNLVVSNTIFVKDRSNLGFLGYTAKENRYSYAEYTREKAETFLGCVMSIAEYVVVDCSSDPEDNILTEIVPKSGYCHQASVSRSQGYKQLSLADADFYPYRIYERELRTAHQRNVFRISVRSSRHDLLFWKGRADHPLQSGFEGAVCFGQSNRGHKGQEICRSSGSGQAEGGEVICRSECTSFFVRLRK